LPRDAKAGCRACGTPAALNQELAARGGGGEVTDEREPDRTVIGLADDEDRPASLAKLEAVDFADAVGTVFARRRTYGHVALPTRADP